MNEGKRMREGLSSFVAGLAGQKLLVELRGNEYVNGTLEGCDCYLNLRLRDVSMLQNGKRVTLKNFFIRGKHVRFVHMENYRDVVQAVRRGIRARN